MPRTACRSTRAEARRTLLLATAALAVGLTPGCATYQTYQRIVQRTPTGVDLNRASRGQLADLPGVTEEDAERIIRERPYGEKDEIVRRGIVSPDQFEEFENRIYVSRVDNG